MKQKQKGGENEGGICFQQAPLVRNVMCGERKNAKNDFFCRI